MDLISRQAAIDDMKKLPRFWDGDEVLISLSGAVIYIQYLPSAQPEPLTDKEQRIFLAAMEKEEKVCKQVDKECIAREPYEDTLMWTCKEIKRKVKGALWT